MGLQVRQDTPPDMHVRHPRRVPNPNYYGTHQSVLSHLLPMDATTVVLVSTVILRTQMLNAACKMYLESPPSLQQHVSQIRHCIDVNKARDRE